MSGYFFTKSMKTIFITGTTQGIGKALIEALQDENNVFSISRKEADFILDLSNVYSVNDFQFPEVATEEVVLINNAGILGEIKRVCEKEKQDTTEVFNVNIIAPILLCEKFVKKYKHKKIMIINISSGAGRRPIASWANYCASKAALDMFSETLQLELNERKIDARVFSLAPGMINTNMQEKIRLVNESDFSSVKKYIDAEKKLFSPKEVARYINRLIDKEINTNKVILRIEDLCI